jgi:peptidoglycan/xylan/chitin deacetylase (PgdA/CDA1 family)
MFGAATITLFCESSEAPSVMWSATKTRLSHRFAMHVPVSTVRLSNPRPMVSVTFDDVPSSAATTGAAALEAFGATATFYVSGSKVGHAETYWDHANSDELASLHTRGHELACHTYSHQPVYRLDDMAMARDIGKNRGFLKSISPSVQITNFAYPFGLGSLSGKRQLGSFFKSCRSIVPGINAGSADLHFLKAMPMIEPKLDRDRIDRIMDHVLRINGWLIFYTHDVSPTHSPYGCSPALLEYALQAAERRRILITNVAEGLKLAGV